MGLIDLGAGLLLASAAWALAPRPRRRFGTCVLMIAALVAGSAVAATWSGLRTAALRESSSAELRPRELADEGYASSATCRACHPREHATWHVSYHRTMTQPASPATVHGNFDDPRLDGLELERVGDSFWAKLPGARRRIVMTTGSHHYQVYWYTADDGRNLLALPYVWLLDERRWIPRGSAFLGPTDQTKHIGGLWNRNCVKCHATRGRPGVRGDAPIDTTAVEYGIACEACHGPGAAHVARHREPAGRISRQFSSGADETIVQPARLDNHRSTEVCGQCHGIWRPIDRRDWSSWLANGASYRPGQRLGDTAVVLRHDDALWMPRIRKALELTPGYRLEDQFWSDGMVRVSGREYNGLLETACYLRGEMSCLSCHTMHAETIADDGITAWRDDQLSSVGGDDEACLQCHAEYRERLTEHTHHAAASSGSRCYNCHMPYTTYGLMKAIRSHRVDSPDVAVALETGRPDACGQCHLDRPAAWTAARLTEWYDRPLPRFDDEQRATAVGVRWALSGDAGQRALAAWSMGWSRAIEASGDGWMEPFLIQLLDDPYEVVRRIALRSLRRRPAFGGFDPDVNAEREIRHAAIREAMELWRANRTPARIDDPRAVLLDSEHRFDRRRFAELLARRDDRDVRLFE